jgi:hypothetical protein
MPPLLMEAHAPQSQSEIEGEEAMMGGLCGLVVRVWLCGLVVGLVARTTGYLLGYPATLFLRCSQYSPTGST